MDELIFPEHEVKFPYCVRDQHYDRSSKIDWCFKNFGPCRERWDYITVWNGIRFYFQTEADVVWFKLRWA